MINPYARIRELEEIVANYEAALNMSKAIITPEEEGKKYHMRSGDTLEISVGHTGYIVKLRAHDRCVFEMIV